MTAGKAIVSIAVDTIIDYWSQGGFAIFGNMGGRTEKCHCSEVCCFEHTCTSNQTEVVESGHLHI